VDTLELLLAVLGGVVTAALMCWAAVRVAVHVSRRRRPPEASASEEGSARVR
jgi:hypothetical protein